MTKFLLFIGSSEAVNQTWYWNKTKWTIKSSSSNVYSQCSIFYIFAVKNCSFFGYLNLLKENCSVIKNKELFSVFTRIYGRICFWRIKLNILKIIKSLVEIIFFCLIIPGQQVTELFDFLCCVHYQVHEGIRVHMIFL